MCEVVCDCRVLFYIGAEGHALLDSGARDHSQAGTGGVVGGAKAL